MKKSILIFLVLTLLISLSNTAFSQNESMFKNFPRVRVMLEAPVTYVLGDSENDNFNGGLLLSLGAGINYRTGYNNMLSSTFVIGYNGGGNEDNAEYLNKSINLVFTQVLKSTYLEDGSRSTDIMGPGFQVGLQRNFPTVSLPGEDEDIDLESNIDGIARFCFFSRGLYLYLGYNFNITKLTIPDGKDISTNSITFGLQLPLFTLLD